MDPIELPGPEAVAAVLAFRPWLAPPRERFGRFVAGQENDGTLEMGFVELDPDVEAFVQALYANGFIVPFDWPAWQREAEDFLTFPERLEAADLDTLVRLLTLHIRKERFCEGHLEDVLARGHIQAILNKLAEIHGPASTTRPPAPFDSR